MAYYGYAVASSGDFYEKIRAASAAYKSALDSIITLSKAFNPVLTAPMAFDASNISNPENFALRGLAQELAVIYWNWFHSAGLRAIF